MRQIEVDSGHVCGGPGHCGLWQRNRVSVSRIICFPALQIAVCTRYISYGRAIFSFTFQAKTVSLYMYSEIKIDFLLKINPSSIYCDTEEEREPRYYSI